MTMYHCLFTDYNGAPHWLDTVDPAKIGPWLAEMFMLWPYNATTQTSIKIDTWQIPHPAAR